MSQTETILLIVLGFSLASLIALFLGRLVWAAALRVGARRMQRQVPSSLVGLQTERDRLRAEYAMLSQRLGARLEAAKLQMAEHMAEVSRHRNRLQQLENAEGTRDGELKEARAQIRALEAELRESKAREVELRNMLAAREEQLRKLRHHPPAPEPPPPPPLDPELRLRQRIDKLTELARSKESDDVTLETLATAERETEALEKELEKLDQEWAARLAEESRSTGTAHPTEPEVANVISLSNRIRDLKKGLGPAS